MKTLDMSSSERAETQRSSLLTGKRGRCSMLCLDCELAENGVGCSGGGSGVCGRSPEVAAFQNLLLDFARKLARQMVERSSSSERLDRLIVTALAATAAGTNFDEEELRRLCGEVATACGIPFPQSRFDQLELAERSGIAGGRLRLGNELAARLALLFTGIRGIAVFYSRVLRLGGRDERIFAYLRRALAYSLHPDLKPREMLKLLLDCGSAARSAMDLLGRVQTAEFGDPVPVEVCCSPRKGAAVLVTGHDLGALAGLLDALSGTAINVYTHGELLAAHGYPKLHENPRLAGHLGGAWQDQQRDFQRFPGPVLVTGNCVMPPLPEYAPRFFTCGTAFVSGAPHLKDGDFSALIEAGNALPGFPDDVLPRRGLAVGYGRAALERLAGKLAGLIRSGKVRRLFLIGGCDSPLLGEEYSSSLARAVPADCIVLTLGCAKCRLRAKVTGEIEGIPRLLDVGQCTDIIAVLELLETLGVALDLPAELVPFSIFFSWHGQSAVAILLALLSAGFRDIRFGPVLPAFVTPEMREIMERLFNLRLGSVPEEDFAEAFQTEPAR